MATPKEQSPLPVKLVPEAWILMGHEFMEMKNTPAAAWINQGALDLRRLVVGRERFGAFGVHIPYIFPIQWGAKELLRVSQPSNSR